MKTLITDGLVVTPTGTVTADLLMADGRVAAVGPGLPRDGAKVLPAAGKYVLPGFVDVHTHITLNAEAARGTDVFYHGTIPAAMGGTTTIVDHLAFGPVGQPLRAQIAAYRALADGQAVVDYGFHGVIQHLDAAVLAELKELRDGGYSSVKAYMTYDFRLTDREFLALLRLTRELGMMLTVHAETHETITRLRAEFKAAGRGEPLWHPRSRPAECENEAIARLLRLAAEAGDAPVYVVHLSTAKGLEAVRKARAAGQKNIFAETCTQYLTLTEERYADPLDGLKYIMSPPLRTERDVEALWQGVANGDIQTIATDHCNFSFARDKQLGIGDFTACPGGAPGLEERLPVLFSEGVLKGRITLDRLVRAAAAAPAEIFGIYPQKGALLPGSDADVVIFDPMATGVLQASELHGPADYSLYEGMPLQGRIESVFLRGRRIANDNVFLGQRGEGHFLRRGRSMHME